MQNYTKKKNSLPSKLFYAITFGIILLFSVSFITRYFTQARFDQKKERIDFFTLEKNIKWRGFEFFYGKNPTCYHYIQIDSVFSYDSDYTQKDFSQFLEQNQIKESDFEEVLSEYKHFLKTYNLHDPALLFFQQRLSAAKVERSTVTIFIFWKLEKAFYNVKIVFFTL